MNVGELLRERERLLGVIEEAKSARARLKQLNVLIAMYGEDKKVALLAETCLIEGCENPQLNRGLCNLHYGRLRRAVEQGKESPETAVALPSRAPWTKGHKPTNKRGSK